MANKHFMIKKKKKKTGQKKKTEGVVRTAAEMFA